MRVVLPTVMPPIMTYPNLNAPLAIALVNEQSYEWFYNKFVQIYGMISKHFTANIRFLDGSFGPSMCPYVNRNVYTHQYVNKNFGKYSNFIKHCIDSGYYVYTYIDQYFVEKSYGYQTRHYLHPLFISGYDVDKETIIGGDFFRGIYSFEEIGSKNVDMAFCYSEKMKNQPQIYYDVTTYTPVTYKWDFDLGVLITSIEDYINQIDSTGTHYYMYTKEEKNDFKYGMGVYDVLYELLSNGKCERKTYHIFYEHKKMMVLRLQFLKEHFQYCNEEVNELFKIIQEKSLIARNLVMKNEYKYIANIEQKLLILLKQIENMELAGLLMLLDDLRKIEGTI